MLGFRIIPYSIYFGLTGKTERGKELIWGFNKQIYLVFWKWPNKKVDFAR